MNKSFAERRVSQAEMAERYARVKDSLSERARRHFVANEAIAFGFGGIVAAHRATGVSISTIRKGIKELGQLSSGEAESLEKGRERRPGAGRKKATDKSPSLLSDLQTLVESSTREDPQSPLSWPDRSLRNLAQSLCELGHQISAQTIAKLLKELGYTAGPHVAARKDSTS